jgi:hypothetical protein
LADGEETPCSSCCRRGRRRLSGPQPGLDVRRRAQFYRCPNEAFDHAGITDPAEHDKGKKLRVMGEVIHENGQVRIRVEDPQQIEVVEDKR